MKAMTKVMDMSAVIADVEIEFVTMLRWLLVPMTVIVVLSMMRVGTIENCLTMF